MMNLTLVQFPRGDWGIPNESPFCCKLETYLRMVGASYNLKEVVSPKKGPHGKVPYIEQGSHRLGDSGRIIDSLEKKYGLDQELSEKERAHSLLVMRTLEEHLYWGIVHTRWMDPKGYQKFTEPFRKQLPFPIGYLLPPMIKRVVKKELWYGGIGRHHSSHLYELCLNDLKAICSLLDRAPYFFGDQPHIVDAALYGSFLSILFQPWKTPLFDYLSQQDHVLEYCLHISQVFYSEFPCSQKKTFLD